MIDDNGTGTTGTIINNAWKTELYNQIDAYVGPGSTGTWVVQPHVAGNYSADVGTWSVTAAQYAVCFLGYATLAVICVINTSTITGSPNLLRITLPYTPVLPALGVTSLSLAGVYETGVSICNSGAATIFLRRPNTAPFTAGACLGHVSIIVPLAQ
jgi:hypothetical protein